MLTNPKPHIKAMADSEKHIPKAEPETPQGTDEKQTKLIRIRDACRNGDLDTIAALALSKDGLLDDDVRKKVWPLLLGYAEFRDDEIILQSPERPDWESLPPHNDEEQVKLDVERSFVYYPKNMSPRETSDRKKDLSNVINEVLRRHPKLCYFQGFHDICQVFLLVLGSEDAALATEHIALLRIRDFMLPSLAPALDHLHLLYPVLLSADKELCIHLSRTKPFFALAATLTLYAHDIQEYSNIARLFDVFLATDPVFPIYLFAQVVVQRRDELFEIPDNEPEMLHSILSKLPKPLDLEGLISKALVLLNTYPPEKLSTWNHISAYSVLKTSRRKGSFMHKKETVQTNLAAAEKLLIQHAAHVERRKRYKEYHDQLVKHRPQLIKVGLTIAVGASAIALGVYLNRSESTTWTGWGIFNTVLKKLRLS